MYSFGDIFLGDVFPSNIGVIIDRLKLCEDVAISPEYVRKHIKRVIFNNPATVVLWKDNTKTIVKCCEGDTYDKEKGLMACIIKKLTGNTGRWNEIIKEWCDYENS